MPAVQTGLILQGGGALGAYEFGVLRRLFEEPGGFAPDVISGVSIGAINASALAAGRLGPLPTLAAIWEEFTVLTPWIIPEAFQSFASLFGNAGFFHMRTDYYNLPGWTSFYDTTPLRRLLGQYIDCDRLNTAPPVVALTATDVSEGCITRFSNFGHDKVRLSADHIIASGSLPPGFPFTRIEGRAYWDGGLFDNTPLGAAIDYLKPDRQVRKRLIVVRLFPNKGRVPRNMLEVFDRCFEVVFAQKFSQDLKTLRQVNEYVAAINAIEDLLQASPPEQAAAIRALPGYQLLIKYLAIQDLIIIENTSPEIVFGPFDFSKSRIRQRIEAGYRDADVALTASATNGVQ